MCIGNRITQRDSKKIHEEKKEGSAGILPRRRYASFVNWRIYDMVGMLTDARCGAVPGTASGFHKLVMVFFLV